MDQASIADEGDYAESEVDDLTFGEVLAQNIESRLGGLTMVAGENIGKTDCRLFPIRQFFAALKIGQLGDQLFSESLLPCQGKPGAHSQSALVALGDLQPRKFGQLHVD